MAPYSMKKGIMLTDKKAQSIYKNTTKLMDLYGFVLKEVLHISLQLTTNLYESLINSKY